MAIKVRGLGILAAIAINAIETTDQDDLVTKLARQFTEQVWARLIPKKR